MNIPIISTKLYIPSPRSKIVIRRRLFERLDDGLHRRLTIVSASAGFGKTTLVSEWLAGCDRPVAWLSIDEGDNELACFLTYLYTSLQRIATDMGEGILGLLQSSQPVPIVSILTTLLNEIDTIPYPFILVLDDYHVIKTSLIDQAIALLIERMPPLMHLVIITREDPNSPIARLRVRDQLTEIRATELRFTASEAAEFLDQVMGLNLTPEEIDLLESRTEGWIAGLQLAALSMQGHEDPVSIIQSFSGSHHFVLDYLVEEVLQHQSAYIHHFLLRTSILDRLCGPLCDAILSNGVGEHFSVSSSGQEILEYLDHVNLFIVPLDNERKWYRYHHLFADLLQKRLSHSITSNIDDGERGMAELHILASKWYEENGLEIEAFHHAAMANDTERAARLMEGDGMPLLFRGVISPVLNWLNSLSNRELDAMPSLWIMYASALLLVGQMIGVEHKLRAAEKALQNTKQDDKMQDLIGHIASIRATLAVSKHDTDTIMTESRRALENLHPDNLPVRTATTWTLGYAYQLQGNRTAANKAYTEALSISQMIGHKTITIMATLGLGNIQEADNQLDVAAQSYRRVLHLAGNPPLPIACEAHLGLARILYEWNELDAAMQHGQQTVQLAKHFEHTDRVVAGEVILARLQLVRGQISGAIAILAKADQSARQENFVNQMPLIATAQVLALLHLGNLDDAAHLAQKHDLQPSLARVYLAQGNTSSALLVLEPLRRQAEVKELKDERLKIMVIQAVALHTQGEKLKASQMIVDALTMAEPGGFIRIFVDEGMGMYRLLSEIVKNEKMPKIYLSKLLAAFEADELKMKSELNKGPRLVQSNKSLIEPLSGRELEVLHLIAQGLSNLEISEQLFISLTTVKGHNRSIFDKLQVARRTEAVALARKLGLL